MRSNTSGYGHYCVYHRAAWGDWYEIGWLWDKYYPDSRLRYPRRIKRITDEAGAHRFRKKWELPAGKDEAQP